MARADGKGQDRIFMIIGPPNILIAWLHISPDPWFFLFPVLVHIPSTSILATSLFMVFKKSLMKCLLCKSWLCGALSLLEESTV